jgi:hypothetical protein
MKRYLLIIIIILTFSCKKEEKLLTGDIIGKVTVYNMNGALSDDLAGITVNVSDDKGIAGSAITDDFGQYRIEGIGYGKYALDLQKDKYIERDVDYTVYHVGGYSPSIKDAVIYEMPDFTFTIDSLLLFPDDFRIKLYVKINGSPLLPFPEYRVLGYCSTSPEASMNIYENVISGRITSYTIYPPYDAPGEITGNVWKLNTQDTWYIRFYLQAYGQSFSIDAKPGTLGSPSNVITFKWK